MPPILRSRLALFGLLATFLVPVGMSSLRGLTHILTCTDSKETPFTIFIAPPELGGVQVTSSNRITRGEEDGVCGGLFLEMGASIQGSDTIAFDLGIANRSDDLWRGTIAIKVEDTEIPVGIGEIPAGGERTESVSFQLDEGQHEIDGSLLIGP